MKKALVAPVLATLVSFAVLTLMAGCEDEDVGIPCRNESASSGGGTEGGGSNASEPVLSSNALDCRSRLCLAYGNRSDENFQPLCTRLCDTDDDCPDSAENCPKGEKFVCMAAKETGALKCCKMCICRYFLPAGGAKQICQGITPDCPSL